jgi:hypothetical protein
LSWSLAKVPGDQAGDSHHSKTEDDLEEDL